MKCPSSSDWSKWRIEKELHQFFSLYWDEILDEEVTPDTWQVRTCNVRSILREIIDSAQVASSRASYRKTIRSLIDELESIANRDPVLKSMYPFSKQYIARLKTLTTKKDNGSEIGRFAVILHGNLGDYLESCQKRVIELLTICDDRNKKEIYDTAMCAAVELIHAGYSARYLSENFSNTVFIESEITFLERITLYFGGLNLTNREYTCYFGSDGLRKDSDMGNLPPDVAMIHISRKKDKSAIGAVGSAVDSFMESICEGGVILKVAVKAKDPISAADAAEQRAGQLLANYRLFDVDRHIATKKHSIVVNGDKVATVYTRNRISSKYLGGYESRNRKAGKVMQIGHIGNGTQHPHIDAATQYHRLAMVATSEEASFINMWIAIEALCQGATGNILTRVCKSVSACVSIDNVWKTLKMLARYIHKSKLDKLKYQELFNTKESEPLDPYELLNILVMPNKTPRLLKLCELCKDNCLLMHRLWRFRESTLLGPASVANNLEMTKRNVEWQLGRIYRLRNDIVHSGKGSPLMPQLFQHLHSYFNKTMMAILDDILEHPEWDLQHSLEHRISLFEFIINFYRNPSGAISTTTITDPANCLKPQVAPFAWPYTPASLAKVVGGTIPTQDQPSENPKP